MKSVYSRTKAYLFAHKIISLIIILVVVGVCYYTYSRFVVDNSITRYVLGTVKKGNIEVAVSGSGQVSAANQVEIKPKTSGDVVYVGARAGDYVSAGQLIVQLDARDAEIALENAKLSLAKITEKTNSGSIGGLNTNYEDSLANVNKALTDFPTVIDGLDDILNNYTVSTYKINLPDSKARSYFNIATASFFRVQKVFNQNLEDSRKLTRPITNEAITTLTEETYATAKLLAQAVKDSYNYTDYLYNYDTNTANRSAELVSDHTDLNTWIVSVDTNLAGLGSSRDSLRNIPFDIETQKLALKQKEYAYDDYFIRAPFSGVIGRLTVNRLDSVSSGSSIGTLVSYQKVANVSLNEVDVVKVKAGQKAVLTFDAVSDLEIDGKVTEVDTVGVVSSGVVSYNVKIEFNSQDERVRPGMSVNANIITETKKDVLVVPSSAIKTNKGVSTVEVPTDKNVSEKSGLFSSSSKGVVLSSLPVSKQIKIGLADDRNTEVVTGLIEGEKIIVRTIAGTNSKTTTAPSIFGSPNRSSGNRSSGNRSTAGMFH